MSVTVFETLTRPESDAHACLGEHCSAFSAIIASVEGDASYHKNNIAMVCGLGRELNIQYNSECAEVGPVAVEGVQNA